MNKSYKAIIFDLGGVLAKHREKLRVLDWLEGRLDRLGFWNWWIHSELVKKFETGKMSPESFAEGIIRELGLRVTVKEYLADLSLSFEAIYPGATELLRKLSSHYVLGALSNTNELLWERCNTLGILACFHQTFPSHKIGFIKPDHRIYRHVITTLNLPPEQILFLDDNKENVTAARSLGIDAHMVKGIKEAEILLLELRLLQ